MARVIAIPLGAKAQLTLPKAVRHALGIHHAGEYLCFTVEKGRVALTKAEIVPSRDPFSEEEWRKIRALAAATPVMEADSSKESLRHLKSRLGL